jgi:anaerobic selenocysteine-containing dehydrogenase
VVDRLLGDPRLAAQAPVLLYRTMALPPDLREGAVLLGLALRAAMQSPASLERAGFGGSPMEAAQSLFDAILASPSGVVFSVDGWDEVLERVATPDGKIRLALPDLLAELGRLGEEGPSPRDPSFPFVLSAGERRSFTANTIIRDPAWRKADAAGALRMSAADAGALGVGPGDRVRVITHRGSAVTVVEVSDTLQRGHVSLPNGLGLSNAAAGQEATGVAPNELTSSADRDPFVGTPWHKHVPARIERA